jgi:hypothetical protein
VSLPEGAEIRVHRDDRFGRWRCTPGSDGAGTAPGELRCDLDATAARPSTLGLDVAVGGPAVLRIVVFELTDPSVRATVVLALAQATPRGDLRAASSSMPSASATSPGNGSSRTARTPDSRSRAADR